MTPLLQGTVALTANKQFYVNENAAAGTHVGWINTSASDPDIGATLTYALTDVKTPSCRNFNGTITDFVVDVDNGAITTGAVFDHEAEVMRLQVRGGTALYHHCLLRSSA